MSDLELTMMRRVGELKAEVERVKKFNEEALAHIAKEERKSRERLDMEQAENARLKAEVERLTAFATRTIIPNEELQAQVERLTKAGDALGSALILFELKSEEERQEYLKNWAIAKYGKLHD